MRRDANVKKYKKIALNLNDLIIKDEDDEELDYTEEVKELYNFCHENVDELKDAINRTITSIKELEESGFFEAASKETFEEFVNSLSSFEDICLNGKFQLALSNLSYDSNDLMGKAFQFDDDYDSVFLEYYVE